MKDGTKLLILEDNSDERRNNDSSNRRNSDERRNRDFSVRRKLSLKT